jgi:putative heme-binding domain-containing protein
VKARGAAGVGETVDVDFPLAGVEASLDERAFLPGGHTKMGTGAWLSHVDLDVVRQVQGGPGSQWMEALSQRAGVLMLRTRLDLPGTAATLTIRGARPFTANVTGLKVEAAKRDDGYEAIVEVPGSKPLPPLEIVTRIGTPGVLPRMDMTYHTPTNPTERPVPLQALLPWWAPDERQPVVKEASPPALTQGGDWDAGRALFFGEAKCSTCHTVRGEGGRVGPNLSNLVHINPESVWQDIVEPSARINPDHVSYIIETKAGDTLSGLVRQEGDRVIVSEAADKVTTIARGEVKEIRPSKVSLMPEGYKELGEKKLKDLVTFLTTEKGKR